MQTNNLAFVLSQSSTAAVAAELERARAAAEASDDSDELHEKVARLEALAAALPDALAAEPFRRAVAESIEVGVVVPSILRARLEAAGFRIADDDASLSDYGVNSLQTLKRVVVGDSKGRMVAMGAAGDHAEAILHAALGWFREHPLEGADVPAGIATTPTQPESPALPD